VGRKSQAYAKGIIANALRVGGQLRDADVTYAEAFELWKASAACSPFLDAARFLDLGASLRLVQRRFDDALALQDQALELVGPQEGSYILLNRSHVQHLRGQYGEALETLHQAASRIDPEQDPRSWFAVQFNRAANLTRLDQHQEAQDLLPTIWDLMESVGEDDLHLLRFRWLAAEINAGLGDIETAIRSLEEVRKEFADQGNPFDAALASLDLAEIHLKQANWPKVRALAKEMIGLFQSQGVHCEALAALLLFREAVEREEATVDLIRRLAQFLQEAREDPSHHFEG
jgi:tetratricopeptide (TPR) repeat protein